MRRKNPLSPLTASSFYAVFIGMLYELFTSYKTTAKCGYF